MKEYRNIKNCLPIGVNDESDAEIYEITLYQLVLKNINNPSNLSDSAVVFCLFVVAPIVCGGFDIRYSLCFVVDLVVSRFAIISLKNRELIALLSLYSECHANSVII